MTQAPHEHRLELLRVFKNTPADLDANRLGQLGPGQLRRLRRSAANSALIMVAVVALGGLVVGVQRSRELRRAGQELTVQTLAGAVRVRSLAALTDRPIVLAHTGDAERPFTGPATAAYEISLRRHAPRTALTPGATS
jgi:ABC-type transporter Mla maintaining outer membrane lipid asymmetry permease subunit MlaE